MSMIKANAVATAEQRRRAYVAQGLDPRMCVVVPEGVNPSDAILENIARTGYVGGHVLIFAGL
jgi:hypothetical protein